LPARIEETGRDQESRSGDVIREGGTKRGITNEDGTTIAKLQTIGKGQGGNPGVGWVLLPISGKLRLVWENTKGDMLPAEGEK